MPTSKVAEGLKVLTEIPPWEWPEDTAQLLVATLRDDKAPEADQRAAADLAGDLPDTSEELVEQLLATLTSDRRTESVRAAAAISLGPVLESCDVEGYANDFAEPPITEPAFRKLQQALRALYQNTALPKLVRRKVLEASVRALEEWHTEAVRAAYGSDDEAWKLTAVFCMGYVRGFEPSILEALTNPNPEIERHAVLAAGNWEVAGAWSHVVALVKSSKTPKPLLLAAIAAVAGIRPKDASDELDHLARSGDDEIADAVEEALLGAEAGAAPDEDDD